MTSLSRRAATSVAPEFVTLAIATTGGDRRRDRVTAVWATKFLPFQTRSRYFAKVGNVPQGELLAAVTQPTETRPWPDVARELRGFLGSCRVVIHDAASALAVADAAGLSLGQLAVDTSELAAILVPGTSPSDLTGLRQALAVPVTSEPSPPTPADAIADVFEGLLTRLAAYDDITLERLAVHVQDGGWPFADLFAPRAAARLRDGRQVQRLQPPEIEFLRERPRPDALEPTGSLQQVSPVAVDAIIGSEGTLSHVIPGFERRSQQERMAAAITEALNDGADLVVEAGTGTGKSLAYLVPAALAATERGDPVVVSTNTLALQDQLLRKDVPDLAAALAKGADSREVAAVSVKGRANYLCLRRWFPWERQPSLEPEEARLKAKVLAWLPLTESGDRAELHLTGSEEPVWRQISEEEGACDPGSCIFHQRGQCFLFRARRAAEGAHLVVVNHALLLTDATSSNRILPDYDTLVIDEAHHLEDQATNQFTVTLSERDLTELADAIAGTDGPVMTGVVAGAVAFLLGAAADAEAQKQARAAREKLEGALAVAETLRASGRALFAALDRIYAQQLGESGSGRSQRVTAATRSSPAWEEVEVAWDRMLEGLREAESTLRWYASAVDEVDDAAAADLEEAGERQQLLLGDLSSTMRLSTEIAARYASTFDAPEAGRVFWMDRLAGSDRLVFRSAPLDVSELLRDRLFKRTRSTVLTSATMAVDGSCRFLATRLGIPDASSLIVPSPFDYRSSVLLYLADDMPEPNHPHYLDALAGTLVEAIAATRGRALVLFTSHAALHAVASAITEPLQERGIVALAQRRDGSPQQLVDRLRREPNVAVLGTASFWEGVDVAGDALSLLVIARLPFSVPTDPVFAARSEAFDDAFKSYAVPQAVLRFKQGFGRLIRSSNDRGICAVLDRRILTKRYGATFVQSLPDCTVQVGSATELGVAARTWLDVADEPHGEAAPIAFEGEPWSSISGGASRSSWSA